LRDQGRDQRLSVVGLGSGADRRYLVLGKKQTGMYAGREQLFFRIGHCDRGPGKDQQRKGEQEKLDDAGPYY
jgi:hypothetical protein